MRRTLGISRPEGPGAALATCARVLNAGEPGPCHRFLRSRRAGKMRSMSPARRRPAYFRLLGIALAAAMAPAAAGDVTIYRCTDAHGRLTVRDTPCRHGERQETRAMRRPTDPPLRAAVRPPAATATPAASAPPPRVLVVHAPSPLYECTTDDGERYTSDTDAGNPRWVPLAVLGFPMRIRHGGDPAHGIGVGGRLQVDHGAFRGRVDFGRLPRRPPWGAPPPLVLGPAYPAGTWIRDACQVLPQQEVCDRLRDRRYELDQRYNSALQSERTRITTEQRGIDARLANDCGVY
jgi:hypothetical protein